MRIYLLQLTDDSYALMTTMLDPARFENVKAFWELGFAKNDRPVTIGNVTNLSKLFLANFKPEIIDMKGAGI